MLALLPGDCQIFLDALLNSNFLFLSRFPRALALARAPSTLLILSRRNRMHFRPLHDRVVVRRIESQEKTAGGIIIPDTAKEKPQEGEIVAAGPGARNERGELVALDVKAGDRILFGKWSGTEVKIDGEDLLIMKESDILGVIEKSEAFKKAA
jgi:chaperonin GroES